MHFFVISALWGSKFRLICPLPPYLIQQFMGARQKERLHLCPQPPLLEDTGIRTRRRERTSAGMRTAAGSTKRKQMQTSVNDAKMHSMQPPSHTRVRARRPALKLESIVEQNWFAKIPHVIETQNLASLHSQGGYMFLYVNILRMHSETPQCDVSTKNRL